LEMNEYKETWVSAGLLKAEVKLLHSLIKPGR